MAHPVTIENQGQLVTPTNNNIENQETGIMQGHEVTVLSLNTLRYGCIFATAILAGGTYLTLGLIENNYKLTASGLLLGITSSIGLYASIKSMK